MYLIYSLFINIEYICASRVDVIALEPETVSSNKEFIPYSIQVSSTCGTASFGLRDVDVKLLRHMFNCLADGLDSNHENKNCPIQWDNLKVEQQEILLHAAKQLREKLSEQPGSFEAFVEVGDAVQLLGESVAEQVAKVRRVWAKDHHTAAAIKDKKVVLNIVELVDIYRIGDPQGSTAEAVEEEWNLPIPFWSLQSVLNECVQVRSLMT